MSSRSPVSSPWCPPGEVRMSPRLVRPFLALLLGLALAPPGFAQAPQPGYPEPLLGSLRYRLVGPFRGGRCAAVTGVPGKPLLFYFCATGAGGWRSDLGEHFRRLLRRVDRRRRRQRVGPQRDLRRRRREDGPR